MNVVHMKTKNGTPKQYVIIHKKYNIRKYKIGKYFWDILNLKSAR